MTIEVMMQVSWQTHSHCCKWLVWLLWLVEDWMAFWTLAPRMRLLQYPYRLHMTNSCDSSAVGSRQTHSNKCMLKYTAEHSKSHSRLSFMKPCRHSHGLVLCSHLRGAAERMKLMMGASSACCVCLSHLDDRRQ